QGYAGQRSELTRTSVAIGVELVLGDQRIDQLALGGRYPGDHQILAGGDTELRLAVASFQQPGNGAQAAEVRSAAAIDNPAGDDAQGQVPVAIVALHPAESIAVVVESECTRWLEVET